MTQIEVRNLEANMPEEWKALSSQVLMAMDPVIRLKLIDYMLWQAVYCQVSMTVKRDLITMLAVLADDRVVLNRRRKKELYGVKSDGSTAWILSPRWAINYFLESIDIGFDYDNIPATIL